MDIATKWRVILDAKTYYNMTAEQMFTDEVHYLSHSTKDFAAAFIHDLTTYNQLFV